MGAQCLFQSYQGILYIYDSQLHLQRAPHKTVKLRIGIHFTCLKKGKRREAGCGNQRIKKYKYRRKDEGKKEH